jgi:hypothetical protein
LPRGTAATARDHQMQERASVQPSKANRPYGRMIVGTH